MSECYVIFVRAKDMMTNFNAPNDNLYNRASAKTLESESGIILEHTSIIAFRKAVLSGDWKNAERLLIDGLTNGARRLLGSSRLNTTPSDIDIVLRDSQNRSVDVSRNSLCKVGSRSVCTNKSPLLSTVD